MSASKSLAKITRRKMPNQPPDSLEDLLLAITDSADDFTRGGTRNFAERFTQVLLSLLKYDDAYKVLQKLSGNRKLQTLFAKYKRYGRNKSLIEWAQKTESTEAISIFAEILGKRWQDILGRTKKLIPLNQVTPPSIHAKDAFKQLQRSYRKMFPGTPDEKLLLDLFGANNIDDLKKVISTTDAAKLDSVTTAVLSSSDQKVLQNVVHRVKGNLGELLVLERRLNHLKSYAKKLKDKYESFIYYPKMRTDYQNLDEAGVELAKLTTDGVIVGKLKRKRIYEILDFDEVKTSQGGARDALFQIHRRGESMGEEGIKSVRFEYERFIFEKGKTVHEKLDKPVVLDYFREGKSEGIFGFHTAEKRIFAPDDRKSIAGAGEFNTTNPVKTENIEGIGLNWDQTDSLATYIVAVMILS